MQDNVFEDLYNADAYQKIAVDASIEIEVKGVSFRFSGPVEPTLYEKTLLMIGGLL